MNIHMFLKDLKQKKHTEEKRGDGCWQGMPESCRLSGGGCWVTRRELISLWRQAARTDAKGEGKEKWKP